MFSLLDTARVAGDDADAFERHVDVTQQQRQCALPHGAEPHHDEPPLEFDMFFFVHFPVRERAIFAHASVPFCVRYVVAAVPCRLPPRSRML